jgi:hypothetical protein
MSCGRMNTSSATYDVGAAEPARAACGAVDPIRAYAMVRQAAHARENNAGTAKMNLQTMKVPIRLPRLRVATNGLARRGSTLARDASCHTKIACSRSSTVMNTPKPR